MLIEFGADPRAVCRVGVDRGRAALAAGQRARLGDGRVRDAAARDAHPFRPRVGQGPDRWAHARDLPARSAGRCAPASTTRRSARTRSCSTATCCQADGGTRTAAITGAYVALADAVRCTCGRREGAAHVGRVAVSVGIVDGEPRLDLCYDEDVRAETDMNVVCTGDGRLRRGAGHRGGRAVRPEGARRVARPCGRRLRELTEAQRAALATERPIPTPMA